MNNEYKTVCDKCYRKTWYETEQQCYCEYPKQKVCKTCHHSEEIEPLQMIRCTGTLRVIDNSDLNPSFTPYYNNKQRVEVAFGGVKGEPYEIKRGTIGKTTGWKPVYLLMLRKNSISSSYTIGKDDKVLKVIR